MNKTITFSTFFFGEPKQDRTLSVILFTASLILGLLFSKRYGMGYHVGVLASMIFHSIVRAFILINHEIYKKCSGSDIDLNIHIDKNLEKSLLINNLNKNLDELEKVESDSKGFFRVMSVVEKTTYTASFILVIAGFIFLTKSILENQYDKIVDGLTISAFGIAIYQLLQAQAKERLSKKVNDIRNMRDGLQLESIMQKIDKNYK